MSNITVKQLPPGYVNEIEYVERKGLGHPDSLIDGIVDEVSHALSREYIEKTGMILHHNVDKGLIIGGSTMVRFGGGSIGRKIEIILAGRATESYNGIRFDVNKIAREVTEEYLRRNTRFLDVDSEVSIVSKIFNGSSDLSGLFMRGKEIPLANDTSFGIGFYPFSDAERLTLETEKYLNSSEYKKKEPEVGEDIKVMALNEAGKLRVTLAIAFVSKFINNLDEYCEAKERVRADVASYAKKIVGKDVDVAINTGDSKEKAEIYMTKTGLSCEAGDDGSVGRGNRVNGLITPFRHMSLEAAAGKNPISHVGKIYNILAYEIAKDVVKNYPEILECDIAILSQIGKGINEPQNLNMNLRLADSRDFERIKDKARYIVEQRLEHIKEFTLDIATGKYSTF